MTMLVSRRAVSRRAEYIGHSYSLQPARRGIEYRCAAKVWIHQTPMLSRLDMVRAGFEAIRTAAVDESNQSAGDVNDAFGKLGTISRTLTCGLAMGCREHYRL
jgi:hypothetical protein